MTSHKKLVISILILAVVAVAVILLIKNGKEKPSLVNNQPTSFRTPAPDNPPHIVNAKVETITTPACPEYCTFEIVKNIDGVSDKAIQKINKYLTAFLFEENQEHTFNEEMFVDVRDPKNTRKFSEGVDYVDHFESKILYIDKGIVGYHESYDIQFEGAAHPQRVPGYYGILEINSEGTDYIGERDMVYFDKIGSFANEHKVLEHFYPNGARILEDYIKSDTEIQDDGSGQSLTEYCYADESFPDSFWPSVNANTGEVVFGVDFIYASIGVCSGMLDIAIPIKDILREVPELVPSDSVLWRLK